MTPLTWIVAIWIVGVILGCLFMAGAAKANQAYDELRELEAAKWRTRR
jgi:hypothetical protein